jgi:hypothetical protein
VHQRLYYGESGSAKVLLMQTRKKGTKEPISLLSLERLFFLKTSCFYLPVMFKERIGR